MFLWSKKGVFFQQKERKDMYMYRESITTY